jgi:hypothetical protein
MSYALTITSTVYSNTSVVVGDGGILFPGAPATLLNSSTIAATSSAGVRMAMGGAVTSRSTGLIQSSAADAVLVTGRAGRVLNQGTIIGATHGVNLTAGGQLATTPVRC